MISPRPPVLVTEGTPNPIKLFDMRDWFTPVRNVLGIGDPDVHKVDGRWTMFLGGFQTSFKNNLFTATLPPGAPLSSTEWRLTTVASNHRRAAPLVDQPPQGSWDAFGLHSPSYVQGPTARRIYYAGRGGKSVTDNTVPYAIGMLEWTGADWERRPAPVLRGTHDLPNVLEPKVRYLDGKWRMWYAATPVEAGKTITPTYQVRYVDSDDGLAWSQPQVLFSSHENFYDAAVWTSDHDTYEMLTCRSTNLYARPDFPKQGLWWLSSTAPSGRRADWTSHPVLLLDADNGPEWYGNGIFGPTIAHDDTTDDPDTIYVFFAGVTKERSWWRTTLRHARSLRPPPVPAPYFFTIGRAQLRRPST
jgi:hypothetical protein